MAEQKPLLTLLTLQCARHEPLKRPYFSWKCVACCASKPLRPWGWVAYGERVVRLWNRRLDHVAVLRHLRLNRRHVLSGHVPCHRRLAPSTPRFVCLPQHLRQAKRANILNSIRGVASDDSHGAHDPRESPNNIFEYHSSVFQWVRPLKTVHAISTYARGFFRNLNDNQTAQHNRCCVD
jgi:hypothetical protein